MVLTPYLELENVSAYLGERRVFDGLNLELNLGEQTAVLGPNGAGKSALVKLISREIYPLWSQAPASKCLEAARSTSGH